MEQEKQEQVAELDKIGRELEDLNNQRGATVAELQELRSEVERAKNKVGLLLLQSVKQASVILEPEMLQVHFMYSGYSK